MIVKATLNKEERNLHVVSFLSWLCPISPFANAISQAMIVKEDAPPENSRLVRNGTTKLDPKDIVMNDVMPLYNEAPIVFGVVLT